MGRKMVHLQYGTHMGCQGEGGNARTDLRHGKGQDGLLHGRIRTGVGCAQLRADGMLAPWVQRHVVHTYRPKEGKEVQHKGK